MLVWRKSSYSNTELQGSCVELARDTEMVAVRDSKNPAQSYLRFDRATLSVLLATLKSGVE
jgi:hypothetical protein